MKAQFKTFEVEEKEMKISIICPLYNAENYIEDLYFNIKKQKDVSIVIQKKN